MTRIRLRSNTGRPSICRGCGAEIVWMNTLTGKHMPMNGSARPCHCGDGVDVYDAADAHWASCPARAMFDKRSRSHA